MRLLKVLLIVFELLMSLGYTVILLLLAQGLVSLQDAAVGLDVSDVGLGRLAVHVHIVGVERVSQAGHGVHVDRGCVLVKAGVQLTLLLGGALLAVHGSQVNLFRVCACEWGGWCLVIKWK
ncbi:MAG: hypothetical protein BYD32DRAFT_403240 [Podila humilis]|nr:MAG: hypothetical protein BYD32DRAFT_403240 [Podila humilis]